MSESVENVKQVIADLRAWSAGSRENGRTSVADKFDALIPPLESAVTDLVRLYGLTTALPADLGNIHDLPPELLEELSVAKTDELEDQLVTVIKAYGDEASLDQILVGLYRKFKVSQKRRFIQNKLYRMDTVWSIGGKKGVYTTIKPLEPERPRYADPESGGYEGTATDDDIDSQIPF